MKRYTFVDLSNVVVPGLRPRPFLNASAFDVPLSVRAEESYLSMNVRFSTVKPFVSA